MAKEIFKIKGTVLKEYRGESNTVVVPEGITEIATGGLGYEDGKPLEEVYLPDSVRKIHKHAFFSKEYKAMMRGTGESLDDYIDGSIPKKMNIPKDFLKQKDLDIKLIYELLMPRGPWRKLITDEDCLALYENYNHSDLPLFLVNRVEKINKKKKA